MGRRKKDDGAELYSAFIGIQLKPSQRRALEAEAAKSELKLSDYGRAVLVRESTTAIRPGRDKAVLRGLAVEVSRIGNNLNQMALRANVAGQIRSEDDLRAALSQLADVFARIIAL